MWEIVTEPDKYCAMPDEEILSKTGQKDDGGKLDWDLIPLELIEAVIPAFEAGIRKGYQRHNCAEQFEDPRPRFVSAMLRHLRACQRDPKAWNHEDGCSHSASMVFEALMFNYHCAGLMRGEKA